MRQLSHANAHLASTTRGSAARAFPTVGKTFIPTRSTQLTGGASSASRVIQTRDAHRRRGFSGRTRRHGELWRTGQYGSGDNLFGGFLAVLTGTGTAPVDRAISTAGRIAWSRVDEHFILTCPLGTFVASEMLDSRGAHWRLLATGLVQHGRGRGALGWLGV